VGQKLSIVTPRPQTTRHRILGIYSTPQVQIAFLDTPGLHREAGRALNKAMNRTATAALEEADVVVLVLEALKWTPEDDLALERLRRSGRAAIAAVNKVDRVRPRERLLPYLGALGERHPFLAVVPVSALRSDNVEALRRAIAEHQPAGPALFPEGELTDRGIEFRIAEMIREKLTLELNQEVPYGIAVEVERLTRADGQLTVDAAIWVDREGQKPIVIGAKGARLKRVGTAARLTLNEMLQERLHLNLWVKVRENWADNARALKELGLE
jgi:GTP-binding protein Era